MHLTDPFEFDGKKKHYFYLGRGAMYAACKLFGLKEGDEVLTPAFDCDSAVKPFKALGLKVIFYKTGIDDLTVDISDIKNKITNATKLLHVINHFGMPQPWECILPLKKASNMLILEDNAYSFFSAYKGKPLGTFGDASIVSLRKNLPIPDGGMLRINNEKYERNATGTKTRYLYDDTLLNAARMWVKKILGTGISRKLAGRKPAGKGDRTDIVFAADPLRPMSGFSRNAMCGYSKEYFERVAAWKIEVYRTIMPILAVVQGLKALWPNIPEGAIPYSLVLLIDNTRDALFERLSKRYSVMIWPTFDKDVIKLAHEFPEVNIFMNRSLEINLEYENIRPKIFAERLARDIIKCIHKGDKINKCAYCS